MNQLVLEFYRLIKTSWAFLPKEKNKLIKYFPYLKEARQKEIIDILKKEIVSKEEIILQNDREMIKKIDFIKVKVSQRKSLNLRKEHFLIEKEEELLAEDFLRCLE